MVDVAGVVWVMAADAEVALGVDMIKTDRSGESTRWRDERLSWWLSRASSVYSVQ